MRCIFGAQLPKQQINKSKSKSKSIESKSIEKNKKKNDDSSSTKSMSEAQEKAMMDDIFMKVCTREACKGIDLETYMEIEKSETGIKTSGIERTGQFADQDEL